MSWNIIIPETTLHFHTMTEAFNQDRGGKVKKRGTRQNFCRIKMIWKESKNKAP